jgi:hypothetical protein
MLDDERTVALEFVCTKTCTKLVKTGYDRYTRVTHVYAANVKKYP